MVAYELLAISGAIYFLAVFVGTWLGGRAFSLKNNTKNALRVAVITAIVAALVIGCGNTNK